MAYLLKADCSRGEFTVMWKAQMVASGTGKCLDWLYPMLLLVLAACRLCFISTIKEPAQTLQASFWASLVPYHNFELLPFPANSSPPPTQCKHSWYYLTLSTSQFFSILFGRNFCEQKLVIGKLSMVYLLCKFHSHAHNPWLVIALQNL